MARGIPKPEHLSQDSQDLFAAINGASPLACALIVSASLEKALHAILGKCFLKGSETAKEILSENGFLSDFSHCASLAYCLGRISKEMKGNLTTIGRIRNRFAHSHVFMDFDDELILKWCMEELTLPKPFRAVALGGEEPSFVKDEIEKFPRRRFSFVGILAFQRLCMTAMSIDHPKKP